MSLRSGRTPRSRDDVEVANIVNQIIEYVVTDSAVSEHDVLVQELDVRVLCKSRVHHLFLALVSSTCIVARLTFIANMKHHLLQDYQQQCWHQTLIRSKLKRRKHRSRRAKKKSRAKRYKTHQQQPQVPVTQPACRRSGASSSSGGEPQYPFHIPSFNPGTQ